MYLSKNIYADGGRFTDTFASIGKMRKWIVYTALLLMTTQATAQEVYTLSDCLEYALQHNSDIQKSAYEQQKAKLARQEVLGALLPQINGSAGINDNLKKAKFVMPNFMNNMLPEKMRDPNASQYMTVEMGTKYTANAGVALSQQILNMPLFNALDIAKVSQEMAALGAEATEEEVVAKTATLFYCIQVTDYAVQQMGRSVDLVEKMLKMMEVNYVNGLVKRIDVDRVRVNLTNLKTQKAAIESGLEVQKNLLKLQMGWNIDQPISLPPMDFSLVDSQSQADTFRPFNLMQQVAYRQLLAREKMAQLQNRAKKYEYLPTLTLIFNLQYNRMSDQLFKSSNSYSYPTAMVGLNLKIPIFSGLSRSAKVKESHIDLLKAQEDLRMLGQSLQMARQNALLKLQDTKSTIALQKDNQALAEEVFHLAQKNFDSGVASLSDVLNATQSLIQAQLSYASALGDYMQAYIDLKKVNGEVMEMITNNH